MPREEHSRVCVCVGSHFLLWTKIPWHCVIDIFIKQTKPDSPPHEAWVCHLPCGQPRRLNSDWARHLIWFKIDGNHIFTGLSKTVSQRDLLYIVPPPRCTIPHSTQLDVSKFRLRVTSDNASYLCHTHNPSLVVHIFFLLLTLRW